VQVDQFWSWSMRNRGSSKATISSWDSEIVPRIAQPALIELFVDPRNAIQRKLAQWSLKTFLTARASYQDRRVKLSEFLHAYEDMGLSTTAVARQYFCTMAFNLPYIASWARLVKYHEEWAMHCLARDPYRMQTEQSPTLMIRISASYDNWSSPQPTFAMARIS
jgi:hypothetical protein